MGAGAGAWETWRGVNGRRYARRVRSSPAIVIDGADTAELGGLIAEAEERLAYGNPYTAGSYWKQELDSRNSELAQQEGWR